MTIVMSIIAGALIGWLAGYAFGWIGRRFHDYDTEDQEVIGVSAMICFGILCTVVGGVTGGYFGFWSSLVWSCGTIVVVPLVFISTFAIAGAVQQLFDESIRSRIYNSPATMVIATIACIRGLIERVRKARSARSG